MKSSLDLYVEHTLLLHAGRAGDASLVVLASPSISHRGVDEGVQRAQ